MNGTSTEPNPPSERERLREEVVGMSAPERYDKLKAMLHARGMTLQEISALATKSKKNWPHVSQVLRGLRKGEKTWSRLVDFLTEEELIVLGKEDLSKVKAS